jgi:pre-mRNA-splicing factor RBM22/SLT11
VFGDIKSVIVAHKTKCAFINFTTRTSAELAANKVAEVGLNLKGHSLRVVWARPKPQSNQNDSKTKTSKLIMTVILCVLTLFLNRTYRFKRVKSTCSTFDEWK